MKFIKRARHGSRRERLVFVVIGLAGLVDDLVIILTLGAYTSELRPTVLFSDWADPD